MIHSNYQVLGSRISYARWKLWNEIIREFLESCNTDLELFRDLLFTDMIFFDFE